MQPIGDGAEGIVYKQGDFAIKQRIKKGYRLPEIDLKLRKTRTRREAKILEKLQTSGFTPQLVAADDLKMTVSMGFIEGKRVRDALIKSNFRTMCKEIGQKAAELHNRGVIHSDLTTSNMLIHDNALYIIDFGLSFESAKLEDKAVDLHLLGQALESKHHDIYPEAFKEVLHSYAQRAKDGDTIVARLKSVELRGRNKNKA